MSKFVQISAGEEFSYVDLEDIKSVHVVKDYVPDKNLKLELHYKVVGVNSLGVKVVLLSDESSDKPDKCLEWVSKNVLRK